MKKLVLKINKVFYYGWIIVFISCISILFSSPGQTYSISVFIDTYETEFGYTKTLLSSGYSVATIISGCLLIFIGKATDKFGQRNMMILVGIMLALTTFFNSFASNLIMIYVGFFLLRYFGQGSMTLVPNTLIPQWFDKKRAFAFSITLCGGLIGTLFVPALNLWLIQQIGWENAWRFWGFLLLFVFVPLAFIFVSNKPEDNGLTVENEKNGSDEDLEQALDKYESESWQLHEALKTKEFWIIGLISIIVPMFTTGVTFHFISIMGMRNVERETAVWIIGLIAIPTFTMPILSKLFIEKVKHKYLLFITQLIIFISMVLLLFFVTNGLTAVIFILFYGLAVGIQAVLLNLIWPEYYGRKYLGSIRGAATVFMVIGSALGPLPFGLAYDRTGSYNLAIVIMMLMTIIAMFMCLLIKKPMRLINEDIHL